MCVFILMFLFILIYFFALALQVSWIRRRDYHLLTVSLTTYSSDERYSVSHAKHSEVSIIAILIDGFIDVIDAIYSDLNTEMNVCSHFWGDPSLMKTKMLIHSIHSLMSLLLFVHSIQKRLHRYFFFFSHFRFIFCSFFLFLSTKKNAGLDTSNKIRSIKRRWIIWMVKKIIIISLNKIFFLK